MPARGHEWARRTGDAQPTAREQPRARWRYEGGFFEYLSGHSCAVIMNDGTELRGRLESCAENRFDFLLHTGKETILIRKDSIQMVKTENVGGISK